MNKEEKKVALKGIEQEMYQAYKTSVYAKGKTPLEFEDWRKTLGVEDIAASAQKEKTANIEHSAPDAKPKRDIQKANEKLQEAWNESKDLQPAATYVCTKCNVEKPVTEFYKDGTVKGHMSACKECKKADSTVRQKNQAKSTKKIEKPKNEDKQSQESVVDEVPVAEPTVQKNIKEIHAVEEPEVKEIKVEFQTEEVFTLTKEELIEFGKECYAKGKNSHGKLTSETKTSLMNAIVS